MRPEKTTTNKTSGKHDKSMTSRANPLAGKKLYRREKAHLRTGRHGCESKAELCSGEEGGWLLGCAQVE